MQKLIPIPVRAQAYYLVQSLNSWVGILGILQVMKERESVLDISKTMSIQVIPMNLVEQGYSLEWRIGRNDIGSVVRLKSRRVFHVVLKHLESFLKQAEDIKAKAVML